MMLFMGPQEKNIPSFKLMKYFRLKHVKRVGYVLEIYATWTTCAEGRKYEKLTEVRRKVGQYDFGINLK